MSQILVYNIILLQKKVTSRMVKWQSTCSLYTEQAGLLMSTNILASHEVNPERWMRNQKVGGSSCRIKTLAATKRRGIKTLNPHRSISNIMTVESTIKECATNNLE